MRDRSSALEAALPSEALSLSEVLLSNQAVLSQPADKQGASPCCSCLLLSCKCCCAVRCTPERAAAYRPISGAGWQQLARFACAGACCQETSWSAAAGPAPGKEVVAGRVPDALVDAVAHAPEFVHLWRNCWVAAHLCTRFLEMAQEKRSPCSCGTDRVAEFGAQQMRADAHERAVMQQASRAEQQQSCSRKQDRLKAEGSR